MAVVGEQGVLFTTGNANGIDWLQLDKLAETCDPTTRVLVIGHTNDVQLYRDLMRRGISEYLIAPVDLVDCLRALSDMFHAPSAEPVGRTIATLLADLVSTPEVYKKIVGMQMLVEGLAMGAFATFNAKTNDPVLRRLVQLVMSDEAFHHRFGRLWASKTIKHLSEEEHRKVEDWSAQLFQMLLFNLINAEQKQVIYAKYGLDWQWVRDAMKEVFTDEDRRAQLKDSTNIFRVLIKTLLHAGIITARTAPLYAVWVDMKELEAEGDGIPGDIVAEEMLVVLREINAKRRRIGSKDVAAAAS